MVGAADPGPTAGFWPPSVRRFKSIGVTKVDVTNNSIQSTANRIIRILGDRFGSEESSPGNPSPPSPCPCHHI